MTPKNYCKQIYLKDTNAELKASVNFNKNSRGGGKILIISDLLCFILLDFYKDTRYTVMAICKRPCTLYFDATLS